MTPLLELREISKRFGAVLANDRVCLTLERGEVHAILGENGAGKSTLMSILFGLHQPTSGEIVIDGKPTKLKSPADAIRQGIGMVHQNFMLVPSLTVWENIILGREVMRRGSLDREAVCAKLSRLSQQYGLEVDPTAMVRDLPIGVQQRVEILKALYGEARCLILDEPTAVLTPGESQHLFEVVKSLQATDHAVIFISHKLNEVLQLADRITVLQSGRVVGSTTPSATTDRELATMMVGREIDLAVTAGKGETGRTVFRASGIVLENKHGRRILDDIDLDIKAGEIFGIAGIEGNGQSELAEVVTGLRQATAGRLEVDSEVITKFTPRRLADRRIAYVPEDRKRVGLIGDFSISENLILKDFMKKPFVRRLLSDESSIEQHARRLVEEFDIRCSSTDQSCGSLSGGNQQKVILAREVDRGPRVLVASQPTRGLDVGSIEYVYSKILALRKAGTAVLLISSELEEILALSDRIGVMLGGRLVATMDRSQADLQELGLLMAGRKVA